ncbi:MAG: DUF2460 domain-containing protein [Pseudomonadota bacterium]
MGNLVFPTLPGLMWGVSKTPQWTTKIQKAVSGKEFRSAWMSAPLYTFRLSYEVLREGSAFQELQQLAAFFNNVRGSFDSFLYSDPADNAVTAQQFGTGNGVATQFQLVRSYGGNTEAVGAPFMGTATPEKVTNGTFDLNSSGWTATGATLSVVTGRLRITSTVAAAWGANAVQLVPVVGGKKYRLCIDSFAGSVGTTPYVSITNTNGVSLYQGPAYSCYGVTTTSIVFTAATTGNVTVNLATNTNFGNPAVSDFCDFDNVSIKEVNEPVLYANGWAVNPSIYTISSTGLVTFTTPPANAAVLTWTGSYYYRCRFLQDGMEFSAFMSKLWEAKRVEFVGSLSPNRI